MEPISAEYLRHTIKELPADSPGWYRWWCSEESLKQLLNSKYLTKGYYEELKSMLTTTKIDDETYYYIYVGIAVKESVRDRLNWHINQSHSKSSVKSGFLSTFRQSISSLIAHDQYAEQETNDFIDSLYVEYETIEGKNAERKIEERENKEIKNNKLPINIKGNKHPELKEFLKELRRIRKESKNKHSSL